LVPGDLVTVPDITPKDVDKPTDVKHPFVKKTAPPVTIRFVHGSPDKKYLDDDALTVLNVSNFPTNKGGADGSQSFPSGFGFNPNGHSDVDTFKVEVVDPGAGGTVQGVLEAVRPVIQPDGTFQLQPITGVPDAALRKMDPLPLQQVSTGNIAFRSKYMRLVVDARDQAAAAGQTLLTTDAVDAGDETLEVLDQHVRASYVFARCPGTPKCTATTEIPIGEDKLRVKVRVHILQDPATGTPVATVDQARKSVLKYIRQVYAQANMSVDLVNATRTVPAPTNLIAIANGNGRVAAGGGTIQIRVQIGQPTQTTFDFDATVQIATNAGDNPIATANLLVTAINNALAAATPPFAAAVAASENPPLVGQTIGSADILVGDPLTQSVSLSVLASGDASHPVDIGRITSTTIADFIGIDAHVGTLDERTLIKNYDTGSDHIDLIIVDLFGTAGVLGEAFTPNASSPSTRQPIASLVNTALVISPIVTVPDNFHTVMPHEFGHILMDRVHSLGSKTEMMTARVPANSRAVTGPKRISDPVLPRTIKFDLGQNGNPVTFLRTDNTGITEPF
jgi:hypothetical protein